MKNKQLWLENNLSITNAIQWNDNIGNWRYKHPNGLIESFLFDGTVDIYTYREQHPFREGILITISGVDYSAFHEVN